MKLIMKPEVTQRKITLHVWTSTRGAVAVVSGCMYIYIYDIYIICYVIYIYIELDIYIFYIMYVQQCIYIYITIVKKGSYPKLFR